jgi:hypothetical protein
MELIGYTIGKVIGSAPRLDTVLMVEDFLEKNTGEYGLGDAYRSLPKKMMWRTFKIIIAYLENQNKIVINKDGAITWIWNPELVRKYLKRDDLGVDL